MNTSTENILLFKLTSLFLIIAFLITSIRAIVTKDEKKADDLRENAVLLSFIAALAVIVKSRIDIFVSISCCLFIIIFITLHLKNEILKKIFVKWIVSAYMVLAILALIFFRFDQGDYWCVVIFIRHTFFIVKVVIYSVYGPIV